MTLSPLRRLVRVWFLSSTLTSVACDRPAARTSLDAAAAAVAPSAGAPAAASATPARGPKHEPPATRPALPKCAAGTTLAWADNDSAKCLRPCDGTEAACAKGESCTPGNAVDDDGNPIPHDIVDVCLPKPGVRAINAGAASDVVAMESPNPSRAACPAGSGDQGMLATCNKSCKTNHDCTPPFTCESLAGDPPHNCVDLKNTHMRDAPR